jgi:hypothetical protein
MANDKNSFIVYSQWQENMDGFPDDVQNEIRKAIFFYAMGRELPKMCPLAEGFFWGIKCQMDANTKKYEEISKKRSEAGRKSGEVRTKQTKGTNVDFVEQNEQTETKGTNVDFVEHNVNDNVNDNDNVNVPLYNGGDIISPAAQEGNLSLNHQARDFVRFFNEKTEGTCIPQVKKITEKREIAIGRILHTMGRETMEEVIIKATSPNCILAAENRGVGIDWFTNEDNAIKVLEGNYDNTRTNQQGTGMGKQEARHLEQLRQLAGGDPERLAYLEATYTNR